VPLTVAVATERQDSRRRTLSLLPATMAAEGSKAKAAAAAAAAALDIDGHDLPPSPAPSTPRNGGRKYALMTELVYTESSDQYNASSVPIYQVGPMVNSKEHG
jgi:cystathionine beta-lyase